jgi:hypothetical protein
MPMNKDIADQVLGQIKRAMKPGWSLTTEAEGFVLDQPKDTHQLANSELWTETWRIARVVKFDKFLSIEKNSTAGYLILSRDSRDNWFQILVA